MAVLKWKAVPARSATELDEMLNTQSAEGWTVHTILTQPIGNTGWVIVFTR